jgi:stage III sporulation protein AF
LENLQTLVRNLAVILLLASFLEMLLPSKSMQGFVKLVMGLFVISAILNPITAFLNMPLEMSIPAWTETTSRDLPVLAAGSEGSKIGRDAVHEQYKEIIKNQIKALALSVPGVKKAEVEVQLAEGSSGLTDQPRVTLIMIRINSEAKEIKPVEEVVIGQKDLKVIELSGLALEVREKVAALMQLKNEQIIVKEI